MIDFVLPLKVLTYFVIEDIETKNFDSNENVISDIRYYIPKVINDLDFIGYHPKYYHLNSYDFKIITSMILKRYNYYLKNKKLFFKKCSDYGKDFIIGVDNDRIAILNRLVSLSSELKIVGNISNKINLILFGVFLNGNIKSLDEYLNINKRNLSIINFQYWVYVKDILFYSVFNEKEEYINLLINHCPEHTPKYYMLFLNAIDCNNEILIEKYRKLLTNLDYGFLFIKVLLRPNAFSKEFIKLCLNKLKYIEKTEVYYTHIFVVIIKVSIRNNDVLNILPQIKSIVGDHEEVLNNIKNI